MFGFTVPVVAARVLAAQGEVRFLPAASLRVGLPTAASVVGVRRFIRRRGGAARIRGPRVRGRYGLLGGGLPLCPCPRCTETGGCGSRTGGHRGGLPLVRPGFGGVEDLSALFDEVYASARIPKGDLPEDVELLERVGEDGGRHVIALNHTGEDVTVPVDGIGTLEIPAGGMATARIPAPDRVAAD